MDSAYVGQHPTAVSPSTSENCTAQSAFPLAVAVHALEYPAGQTRPGE